MKCPNGSGSSSVWPDRDLRPRAQISKSLSVGCSLGSHMEEAVMVREVMKTGLIVLPLHIVICDMK